MCNIYYHTNLLHYVYKNYITYVCCLEGRWISFYSCQMYIFFQASQAQNISMCVYVHMCLCVSLHICMGIYHAYICMHFCVCLHAYYIDNVSLFVCLHVCTYVLYTNMSMPVECMHMWTMRQGRLYRRYLRYITHPHWRILCY